MTPTDVANKSLYHQGMPPIDSINDNNDRAEISKALIDDCRKEYLEEAAPGFARGEVALAIVSGETSVVWDYVYAYPVDCLKTREIDNGTTTDDPRIEYETGSHSSGTSKVINTNEENAVLIYTRDITNYNMFSKHDIEALSLLLAWKSVMPLKRDKDLKTRLFNEYGVALAIAKGHSKKDQHREQPNHQRYVDSRR
jgi:hypothetical protein